MCKTIQNTASGSSNFVQNVFKSIVFMCKTIQNTVYQIMPCLSVGFLCSVFQKKYTQKYTKSIPEVYPEDAM